LLLQEEREEEQLAVEREVQQRATGGRRGEATVGDELARHEGPGAGTLAQAERDGEDGGDRERREDRRRVPAAAARLDEAVGQGDEHGHGAGLGAEAALGAGRAPRGVASRQLADRERAGE